MGLSAGHQQMLERITDRVSADPRMVGLGIGGSVLAGQADEYSDLDLVVVVGDAAHDEVMAERKAIAASYGTLLACFTGEHVGEPRLLICLYDDPLLHVDLKFVRVDELSVRIEDPQVLWERDGVLTAALAASTATPLTVDPQWIEDRFWTWIHYATTKLGRGELLEVVDALSFLRGRVLAPLAFSLRGLEPRGVRKVERLMPDFAAELRRTVCLSDAEQCGTAIIAAIEIYRQLRDELPDPPPLQRRAAQASLDHLARVIADQPKG